jgi:hypothetical protein
MYMLMEVFENSSLLPLMLQMLSSTNISVPIYMLMEMFENGVGSFLAPEKAQRKTSASSDQDGQSPTDEPPELGAHFVLFKSSDLWQSLIFTKSDEDMKSCFCDLNSCCVSLVARNQQCSEVLLSVDGILIVKFTNSTFNYRI